MMQRIDQQNLTPEFLRKEAHSMASLLVDAAATEVLPRFGNVTANKKINAAGAQEVVTAADVGASKKILDVVRQRFPGSYSEEELHADRFQHDLIWQIDPVDGTQEFCHGLVGGYAMHAALLKKGEGGVYTPVLGIIYLPGVDKMWIGYQDSTIEFYSAGTQQGLPQLKRDRLSGYNRFVDPSTKLNDFYLKLGKKFNLSVDLISGGGAGASVAALLEGTVNLVILPYDYSKEWDLAMAEPIVKARGGFICDLDGNNFTYNRKDVFNRRGYVISLVFSKDEIMREDPLQVFTPRLH